ncbi:MAG: hypothetical protein FVQ79_12705 [Planctomycetes bacterium]|nr:hypothetical protein [Planctomycetota bacterium]
MTKSRSKRIDTPEVTDVICDECGEEFSELSALVWDHKNGLLYKLLCLECDMRSLETPQIKISATSQVKQ